MASECRYYGIFRVLSRKFWTQTNDMTKCSLEQILSQATNFDDAIEWIVYAFALGPNSISNEDLMNSQLTEDLKHWGMEESIEQLNGLGEKYKAIRICCLQEYTEETCRSIEYFHPMTYTRAINGFTPEEKEIFTPEEKEIIEHKEKEIIKMLPVFVGEQLCCYENVKKWKKLKSYDGEGKTIARIGIDYDNNYGIRSIYDSIFCDKVWEIGYDDPGNMDLEQKAYERFEKFIESIVN